MKNLENYGVQEMDVLEKFDINGGQNEPGSAALCGVAGAAAAIHKASTSGIYIYGRPIGEWWDWFWE